MRKLILILVFAGWHSVASAADINVCTEAELNAAIKAAKPGDDIVMCSRKWRDLLVTFHVNGTADKPITLRAEKPGKTIITGISRILMAGRYAVVKGFVFTDGGPYEDAVRFQKNASTPCKFCRLTETSFIDYTTPVAATNYDYHERWVKVYGQNNRVDHNYFSGKLSRGQYLNIRNATSGRDNHRIDHNYFGHRPLHPYGNNGEAIKIGEDATPFHRSGTLIENNYFERSNGEFEIISVKTSEIIVRRNTFDRCEGGLSLRFGNSNWVDANTFLGHRDPSKKVSGIRVLGENHVITNNYISGIKVGSSNGRGGINLGSGNTTTGAGDRVPAKNILVAFNTIVDSDRSIAFDLKQKYKASNIVIANNIISSTHGPLLADASSISGLTFSKNLVHGSSVGVNANGFISSDPKLVVSNGVHRLTSGSPAINQANGEYTPQSRLGSNTVFIDAEAQSRTGPFDIGADEFLSSPGIGYTKRCDTGPTTYGPTPTFNCVGEQASVPMPPGQFAASQ